MSYVVHDDWDWDVFPTLSAALAEAERRFRAGAEDVTLYEEVDWRKLLPPDFRPDAPRNETPENT